MKIRTIYLPIILVCFFSLLICSGCGNGSSKENQAKMQEMTQRLEAMEKKISDVEDIEAIKNLQYTYANMLQQGNFDKSEDILFAKEFTLNIVGTSPQKLTNVEAGKKYREDIAKNHSGQEGDIVIHPVIELLDGGRAKGKFSIWFVYYHPKTYQTLFFAQSWLDMEYVKEDGKWKMSSLTFTGHIAPTQGPPSADYYLNFLDNAQKTMREMKK